ncbi:MULTISPECIES: DUF6470 family protein [Thermoanaerobacter]|uniref:Uncharacterized protein n=2 Tax=Thermoanaerobacter TaxID=1754 RepID=B0KC65_THEP3|nr:MULTISPECIES: DUF6470 family protein [Thermoanaerobacter]ABY95419.1 hypothetical protein Teth39_1782 [Thermoanaerobacter pseudethanolicus ATCC 33223]ADV80362.1 hypothetical protein Thebr_1827 [Thermoanaerobacter brockii subsp. finnii Ako-1]HBW59360.1 hypothetical protein [Thermoanaerobacter sp.]
MNIVINQTFGRIGIDTTPAQISIQSPKADLEIKQIPAKMEIDQKLPQVHIDQYQCFYESGLKSIFDLVHDEAQMSKQIALEAIGKIAEEGRFLASIENHQNAIAELAKKAMEHEVTFTIDLMPKSRPKIWFEGYLKISWELGGVEIKAIPHKPQISVIPAHVNIYMRQYPSIKIQYVGNNLDRRI